MVRKFYDLMSDTGGKVSQDESIMSTLLRDLNTELDRTRIMRIELLDLDKSLNGSVFKKAEGELQNTPDVDTSICNQIVNIISDYKSYNDLIFCSIDNLKKTIG